MKGKPEKVEISERNTKKMGWTNKQNELMERRIISNNCPEYTIETKQLGLLIYIIISQIVLLPIDPTSHTNI
jgi:hypothetical protein